MVSPSGMPFLCGERELARAGAEAERQQRLLVARADDRLAVDALERQAAHAAAPHRVGQRLQAWPDALVVGLHERLEALAAALHVEDGLRAREHDVGAGLPRRA